MRLTLRGRRRARDRRSDLLMFAAGALTATLVALLARRLRSTAPDRIPTAERDYDDVTLARKVESEIFRPADAPKGSVSVNVQHGVVELRGQVKRPEQVRELGEAAARVEGVKDVHNLLHTPGSPPKHSPPSTPEEVRARAEEPKATSRFGRNPATTPQADEPMVERAEPPRGPGV